MSFIQRGHADMSGHLGDLAPIAGESSSHQARPGTPGGDSIRHAPLSPQSHKNAAQARRHLMLGGTDPLSARESGPAPKVVLGVSDQGIGLVNGQLHAWRAQEGKWIATGAMDIANLKLGANNDQVWALHDDGALHQVDADGVAQQPAPFRLPAATRDFAVSPTAAAVTYIAEDGALQRQTDAARPQSLPLPPAFEGTPTSLAQTNNGDLYVASSSGTIWVKPAQPAQSANQPGAAWTRIGAAAGGAALPALGKLQILRDGSLGAEENNGRLCKYDSLKNTWSGTTLHAGSAHRRTLEAKPAASPWNNIRLNAAPGAYGKMGLPASTPAVPGHGDFEAVQATCSHAMDQLSLGAVTGMPALPKLPPHIAALLGDAAGTGVDGAAGRALDAIDKMDKEKKLPRSRNDVNNPDKNTLRAVYNFRRRVLNLARASDPVTQRLAALLNDGVYLPVNDSRTMIAMGKLVVDHALVKQALDDDAPSGPQTDSRARVSDTEAADVTALFDAGMMDADQFKRTNALSASLNAGMAGMAPGLVRAAAPVAGADAHAIGAQFAELVSNLRPGKESIVLNFSHSKGVDLEGLWMFFNLDSQTFGKAGKHVLPANLLPILTPLGTGSHGGTMSLEASRTENGVMVVLSDASTTAASAGVRVQMRFGGVWEKAKGAVTLLAVAGAEGALIPGVAVANERSVAMQFTQDDAGKVQQVIADLYSGEVSLTDLLKRADLVTNTKGESFNINSEGYVHVFGALRSLYGEQPKDTAKGTFMGMSNLVVPALDQVSGKVNYDSSKRVSSDQAGNTSHHGKSGVSGSVDFNHISVIDISTWFSIPYGKDGSTQIQWKIPALLQILNRNLWSNKIAPQGVTVDLTAGGALANAAVTMGTTDALLRPGATDQPLTQALFPQLGALTAAQPGVQPYLDLLNANPGWRPAVTLALTPGATADVQRRIAELAQSGAGPDQARSAFVDLVNRAMSNPANLRIARIDVAASHSLPEQSILAFGPLRATRTQGHTFTAAGASLEVEYDDDAGAGAATGFKVEGKRLLGDAVRPDISALAAAG